MLKKITCIILSIVLIVSVSSMNAKAKQNDLLSVSANPMYVDNEGKTLKKSLDIVNANILDMNMNGDSITLNGIVETGRVKNKFNVSGKLYKSENSNDLVIGDLMDNAGNYEVIYFGISTKPEETLIVDDSRRNEFIKNKILVSLYLRDNYSNQVYFIEMNPTEFINRNIVVKIMPRLKVCERINEFWYIKLLKPISFRELEVQPIDNDSVFIPAYDPSDPYNTYRDVTYEYNYNVMGSLVTEKMTLRHYVDGPSAIYNQGSFIAKLMVVHESTFCYNIPSLNSNDSYMSIGVYGDTAIEAYTAPGDYFQQVIWDGEYYRPGSIGISVSWSLSIPNTGLSFGFDKINSSIYTNHTFKSFNSNNGKYVRQAEVLWTKNKHRLVDLNHNFDHSFTINNLSNPGLKAFNVKFSYDLSNGLDYGYGGPKTVTMTKMYESN